VTDSTGATALTTTLVTDDGVPIAARHDPGPGSDMAVVVAHGLTGSYRRPAVRRAVAILSAMAGVVSFDFRGHGRSGGVSTVGNREILDLAAAVRWARELGYDRVATVGFSMGAAVALRHAAAYRDVAAVVAVSGPSHWYYRGTPAMRRLHWLISTRPGRMTGRILRGTRIGRGGWHPEPEPPDAAAARLSPVPLLIVHGDADPLFPVDHAYALYAAAREPKELWVEAGFGHAENAASPDLLERIGRWVTDPGRRASPQPAERTGI
jgi:pimeloyl-ACP methyl ester carboxylesterase